MDTGRNVGQRNGAWGEEVAAEHLRRHGFEIIDRNSRPAASDRRLEIDIVVWERASDTMVLDFLGSRNFQAGRDRGGRGAPAASRPEADWRTRALSRVRRNFDDRLYGRALCASVKILSGVPAKCGSGEQVGPRTAGTSKVSTSQGGQRFL